MWGVVIIVVLVLVMIIGSVADRNNDNKSSLRYFNIGCVVLVTYDELMRYYMVCPEKWRLDDSSVRYISDDGTRYEIGFKTYKDYEMYLKNRNDLQLSKHREAFLNHMKQDIETYLKQTHETVQQEIENIRLTMQKTSAGNQNIDATMQSFYDFVKNRYNNE